MDARTLARLMAVQALYEQEMGEKYDLSDSKIVEAKIKELADTNDFKRINKKMFEGIITTVSRETVDISEKVRNNLAEGWTIERIGGVLRAILFAAIAEKISYPDTPNKIIMSEYVNITAGFYEEKEVKFVNAILDKILAA